MHLLTSFYSRGLLQGRRSCQGPPRSLWEDAAVGARCGRLVCEAFPVNAAPFWLLGFGFLLGLVFLFSSLLQQMGAAKLLPCWILKFSGMICVPQ